VGVGEWVGEWVIVDVLARSLSSLLRPGLR
jgi:hypothetical protein